MKSSFIVVILLFFFSTLYSQPKVVLNTGFANDINLNRNNKGVGMGMEVLYPAVNPLSITVGMDYSNNDSYSFTSFSAGGRFYPIISKSVKPYIALKTGLYLIKAKYEQLYLTTSFGTPVISKIGISGSAGIEYDLSKKLGLLGEVKLDNIFANESVAILNIRTGIFLKF